jgi:hypothetical protein
MRSCTSYTNDPVAAVVAIVIVKVVEVVPELGPTLIGTRTVPVMKGWMLQ